LDFDRRLDADEIAHLENLANEGIRANARVRAHYGTVMSFADIPYRAKIEFNGPLRLVEIEGYDLCACTSLHVRQTGELGIIQIIQEKAVRGGSRLSVLVGQEALDELKARAEVSEALALEKSCHYTNLMDRLQKDEKEIASLKQEVLALRENYIEHRLAGISQSDQPIAIFIEGDEDEVMSVYDLLVEKPNLHSFLLLRSVAAGAYSFKLYASEIDKYYQVLSEYFEIHGGIRETLAQGRLVAHHESQDELSEALRRLGYPEQLTISFH